jgi:hypothetical protein
MHNLQVGLHTQGVYDRRTIETNKSEGYEESNATRRNLLAVNAPAQAAHAMDTPACHSRDETFMRRVGHLWLSMLLLMTLPDPIRHHWHVS